MNKSIFEFQNYKTYLTSLLKAQPKKGRGQRSRLAEAIGCQLTYISQILNGHVHLNLEQGMKVNRFFGHSQDEAHFFLLLVQFARAGDHDTRKYFQDQIDQELQRRLVIKNRLAAAQGLNEEDQVTYYSAWYYAAVHIFVTIPEFQNKRILTHRLGIGTDKINDVLGFLERTGLVRREGDNYKPGPAQIHLGNDSKLVSRHHCNWRLQAMQSLDLERPQDLHYSVVASISKSDATKMKALLVKQIEELVATIKVSQEEELCAICIDFFGL
jgi:uncharacterized protein (TIGR02147 family)